MTFKHILGVATLFVGPHVPIPEFLQGWLTHVGIKTSTTLLELMRGVATVLLDPFGRVFLRLLFFVVMPLVFASLATGVVQLGRPQKLGPLAGRTFLFFFLNMAIGVALGLVMMNTLEPGHHIDTATKELTGLGLVFARYLLPEAALIVEGVYMQRETAHSSCSER